MVTDSPPLPIQPNAGFVSRSVAFLIDLLIITAANALVTVVVGLILGFFGLDSALAAAQPGESTLITITRIVVVTIALLFSLFWASGYLLFFWLLAGQTPGKSLMGLSVVTTDGRPLTFGRAIRRLIGYWLSALPLFAGFLWVLIDDRRQGWHDKLANTYVVYAKKDG